MEQPVSPLILFGVIAGSVLISAFGYLGKRQDDNVKLRARELIKYKERARKLDNMIFGFPPSYLPKTLRVLIFASILDSLKHVSSLTGDKELGIQIERIAQTLDKLVKAGDGDGEAAMTEPAQGEVDLKECKYLLKDLHSLILEFYTEGRLDLRSTQNHLQIVKKIMLRITLDTYNDAALSAIESNNEKLALHYYLTAVSRLEQGPEQERDEERYQYFTQAALQLQAALIRGAIEEPEEDVTMPDAGVVAQWDALKENQSGWQKKKF